MKKLLSILLSLVAALSCTVALSACDLFKDTNVDEIIGGINPPGEGGENQPAPPHEHEFVDGKCECGADDEWCFNIGVQDEHGNYKLELLEI